MNDNENVISITNRKPLSVIQSEERKLEEQRQADIAQEQSDATEATLKALDAVREMVEQGRLKGLVLLSQEAATGLFLQEVIINRHIVPAQNLFGWAGALQALSLEVTDLATYCPTLLADGTVADPYAEAIDIYAEGDEE